MNATTHLLASVHDVAPETLPRVRTCLELLESAGATPTTLLVVPGASWSPAHLAELRAFVRSGHELAAHGWVHRARHVRGLRHRLHAALISGDVAEHLALDADEIDALLARSARWFADQGFDVPLLYVPPAWALGSLPVRRLAAGPFGLVEVLSGVVHAASGRTARVPMLGYEAALRWRVPFVRAWNAWNRSRGRRCGWLRVAVHPGDLELPLASDLRRDVARLGCGWSSYESLVAGCFPSSAIPQTQASAPAKWARNSGSAKDSRVCPPPV